MEKINFYDCRREQFFELTEIQIVKNFEEKNSFLEELKEIAEKYIKKLKLDEAEETVNNISDENIRSNLFEEIGLLRVEGDELEKAEKISEKFYKNGDLLENISRAYARNGDVEKVCNISLKMLKKVEEYIEKEKIDEAIKLAENIFDQEFQTYAFVEIVNACRKRKNLEKAKEIEAKIDFEKLNSFLGEKID
ncbi:MAG: hypothetical protein AMS24_00545 [Chlamydiae bacterium SM23_39]|nr:MAG: hypothetical protein AMS24_00545 [Chlamydiae bacterium SM23_39]